MATNITKILFRRGTESQRKTVVFNLAEPAYTVDTNRLFIGDGVTLGGKPLTMRNFGVVPSLSGSFRNNLSVTAYSILTADSPAIGDIIYDARTSNIFALTSLSVTPSLSNFAEYSIVTDINSNQFNYTGTVLNIKNGGVGVNELNSSVIQNGGGLSGLGGSQLRISPGSIVNEWLDRNTPAYTVKVNNTNAASTPQDFTINTNKILGRTSGGISNITLSATGGVWQTIDNATNTITFQSTPSLPLSGGTVTGNISATGNITVTGEISASGRIYSLVPPLLPGHLANKSYVDGLSAALSADNIYRFVRDGFLPLSGGQMTGNLVTNNNARIGVNTATPNAPLTVNGQLSATSISIGTNGGILAFSTTDIVFGNASRGSAGGGRALVADSDDTLTINYNNDFAGGVNIGSQNNAVNPPLLIKDGKVGINTSTLNDTLNLSGVVRLTPAIASGFGTEDIQNLSGTYVTFGPGIANSDWAHLRQIGGNNNFSLALDLHDDGNSTGTGQSFQIRNVGSSGVSPDVISTRLIVTGDNEGGKIGINTSVPAYELDVSGDIRATGTVNATTISTTDINYTGVINQSLSGFISAHKDNIVNRTNSGFYQTDVARRATGWPEDATWYQLLASTHTNTENYYGMQFTGNYFDSANLYYRSVNSGSTTSTTPWHQIYNEANNKMTGMVAHFAMETAPNGWVKADGAVYVFRNADGTPTAYRRLYDTIGTKFNVGNEGVNSFRVPDLRGRFMRGVGGASSAFGTLQSSYGGQFVMLANSDDGDAQGGSQKSVRQLAFNYGGVAFTNGQSGWFEVDVPYGDTRPVNIALLACIKL